MPATACITAPRWSTCCRSPASTNIDAAERRYHARLIGLENAMAETAHSIYDFEATSIGGKPAQLATQRGKVMLIVNTASKCGFTPQFGVKPHLLAVLTMSITLPRCVASCAGLPPIEVA